MKLYLNIIKVKLQSHLSPHKSCHCSSVYKMFQLHAFDRCRILSCTLWGLFRGRLKSAEVFKVTHGQVDCHRVKSKTVLSGHNNLARQRILMLILMLLNIMCHIFLFFILLLTQNCEATSGPGSRFKGKHSLDSDEEDEGEDTNSSKYDILASDDVEGMSCLLNCN